MKVMCLLVMLLTFAGLAPAQEPARADISLGYSYFREGFSGGVNNQGGSLSGAGYFNNWFGVVGDFGVYHFSQSGVSANTYTFLAGPRFSMNRGKKVSPFVQALVGGDRLAADGGSAHGFSWSTGGGVDLALCRYISLRPQFDYIGLRFSNGTTNSARASLSIVFRFGGR
jgi:hypothetical protein